MALPTQKAAHFLAVFLGETIYDACLIAVTVDDRFNIFVDSLGLFPDFVVKVRPVEGRLEVEAPFDSQLFDDILFNHLSDSGSQGKDGYFREVFLQL